MPNEFRCGKCGGILIGSEAHGGYTEYVCECGDNYVADKLPALGHNFVDGQCSACGQLEEDQSCEHRYSAVVTAPTCTEGGYTTYTCANCSDSYVGDEVAPLGHNYVSVTTEATCTENGSIVYTCSACGDSYTESIPALGHSFADGICGTCGEADPDYVKPVVQPTLTLNYPTVSFEGEIRYNIYYSASNLEDVVEMGLALFDTKDVNGTVDTAKKVVPGYLSDGSVYMVNSGGIAPKNMADAVYFRVYAKLTDGSYVYTNVVGYNAVLYANSILKNSSDMNMKRLVVSMLNYGAGAQQTFHYNTDNLMNAHLTAEQQALVEPFNTSMMAPIVPVDTVKVGSFLETPAGFSGRNLSASFDGAFSLNYYFTTAFAPEGEVTMYYWTQDDYNAADVLSTENATGAKTMTLTNDGARWANVADIVAVDIDKTVYVAVVYTSGGVTYCSGVRAFSVGAYCNYTSNQAASSAAAVYSYYAKAYFASLAQ